jgi:hypothetical protein
LPPILKTQKIIAYYRYVDDIINDQNKTKIEQTLDKFNNIQPSIKFTIKKEKHTEINYFDITIHHKKDYNFQYTGNLHRTIL